MPDTKPSMRINAESLPNLMEKEKLEGLYLLYTYQQSTSIIDSHGDTIIEIRRHNSAKLAHLSYDYGRIKNISREGFRLNSESSLSFKFLLTKNLNNGSSLESRMLSSLYSDGFSLSGLLDYNKLRIIDNKHSNALVSFTSFESCGPSTVELTESVQDLYVSFDFAKIYDILKFKLADKIHPNGLRGAMRIFEEAHSKMLREYALQK